MDLGVLSLAIPKLLALDVSFVVLLFVLSFAPCILPGGGGVWGMGIIAFDNYERLYLPSPGVPG